jgi:tetratricopeptide (TPR) repeat protein
MWMAASPARRFSSPYSGGTPRLAFAVWLAFALVASASTIVGGEERRLDYLNEAMRAPDSSKFREGDYINSGVGLSFGVDRRLSYFAGQYEEAAVRFEESVRAFRYKSEIWVFLSRAYFFMKEPEKAREAIQRAAAVMPDLNEKLWNPLLAGLLWEIRQRALALQIQIDFYSKEQGDF